MSYLAFRAAVVAAIGAGIPALRTCEPHGGRFDVGELQRYAARAPAVLVACTGVGDVHEQAAAAVAMLRWVAVVIARDVPAVAAQTDPVVVHVPAVHRDAQMLVLSESLLGIISGNRWGMSSTHRPQRIRGDNLYSGQLDKKGIAVWALSWDQAIDHEPIDVSTLDAFETFCYEVDMAPPDDQIDIEGKVELEQP